MIIVSIIRLMIVITSDITIEIKYWLFDTWYLPRRIVNAKDAPIKIKAREYIRIFLAILTD